MIIYYYPKRCVEPLKNHLLHVPQKLTADRTDPDGRLDHEYHLVLDDTMSSESSLKIGEPALPPATAAEQLREILGLLLLLSFFYMVSRTCSHSKTPWNDRTYHTHG